MRRSFVWILVAGLLTACDAPTDVARSHPTMDPNGSPSIVGVHGPVTATADGMAIRYAGDLQVKTNFTVKKFEDGSVDGWFHYAAGGVDLRVDVTCMTVVDRKRAWIAGVIAESTVGFVGHVSYFYTFDNGAGADANPDIISRLRVEATPGLGEDLRFCDELPTLLDPKTVADGNVNVSGS